MPSSPPVPPHFSDSLEFEVTDLTDARHALDELPAGVEAMARERAGGWDGLRRKPLATDRALTGKAIDWLIALPADQRPKQLCETFPRLANLIAEDWPDLALCAERLDGLLHDKRSGRLGFPKGIREELAQLHALLLRRTTPRA